MATVLIIEDNQAMNEMLATVVKELGHVASCAFTIQDGLRQAQSAAYDVVFLDVRLPDGNGLELLPEIRKNESAPEVIILTGFADPDGAELAIKSGAWDYLQKPVSLQELELLLNRVLQYRDNLRMVQKPPVALSLPGIVGNSPLMKTCLDVLAHAANTDANVLITGETGTGKELFARAIHHNSRTCKGDFVVVDCTALPETLVESILFGYEKGAFTGAEKSREGLIKQANGGTLFLDEVGELPPSMQKAFLRVLQERVFRPVGSKQEVGCNFRLLAATNRDLDQMVLSGGFRKDLLYRLRTIAMEIPPLRNRLEDIKPIVLHHTARFCENYGIELKGFSSDFFKALSSYSWPGNVRELVNSIESAVSVAQHEPILFPKHLPPTIRVHLAKALIENRRETSVHGASEGSADNSGSLVSYRDFRQAALFQAEKRYFQDLMISARGNIGEACKISGLGRTRLYTLLKKYEISRFDWPVSGIEQED
jgi:two-component system, NtrC family, response regulator